MTKAELHAPISPARKKTYMMIFGLAILGLGVFILMWFSFQTKSLFYFWDHPLNLFFETLYQGSAEWMVSLARIIGKAGSQGVTAVTVLLLIIWGIRRKFRYFWLLLVTVLGVELLWLVVVFAIGRPRPVEVRTLGGILLPSFPSGHVMLFIAFFGTLLYLFSAKIKKHPHRIALTGTVIFLLLLTGFIRLSLPRTISQTSSPVMVLVWPGQRR